MNQDLFQNELLKVLQSIAESLKTTAGKPPVNMQIVSPVGVDIETTGEEQ
jgi:hypothetical protein